MLTYKKLQEELGGKEKTDKSVSLKSHKVMAFGRMNPITTGHEAVVNKVHEVAKKHNADHVVIVSHSQDAKKNPLSAEQKVKHAKNAFPGTNVQAASKENPTILHHAAQAHSAGAQHLHVIAGSDRHQAMHDLLHKYNGQHAAHGHYNFKSITVHSSGSRDPDAEGTTGISASKMREHAASGNKEAFHANAPSKMKPEHKDAMYNDVRKGMNLKEHIEKVAGGYEVESEHGNKNLGKSPTLAGAKKRLKQVEYFKHMKEETKEQQDDRAAQLKRFKDQMTKANGPKKDTELGLDKKEKEAMVQVQEVLRPDMGAGAYINDFIKSTNPRFNNKSKEERRKMAIGAYMAAKASMKEEVQIDELSTDLLGKYKTAAHASAKAADASGNYAKGDKRFKGINKATNKQFDNDLKKHGQIKEGSDPYERAEESMRSADAAKKQGKMVDHHLHMADYHDNRAEWHHDGGRVKMAEIDYEKAKHHHNTALGLKEGTIQTNGTDQIETSTSAPSASTSKDTTMGKKIKGFKFFNGENDKQMNMNQPIKEQLDLCLQPLEEAAKAIDSGEYDYEGQMARTQLQTILRNSKDLIDMLSDEDNMPEWVQSKITLAQDYITCVRDYLQSKEELGESFRSYSGRSHGHAYGGGGFGKREREDDEYHVPDPIPVAPTIARKYIKGTPENKAAKAASKPINGHPTNKTNEEVEAIDEKSIQARRNKTYKNLMAASKGARVNRELGMTPKDTGHKNNQQMNKAIGRAVTRGEVFEASTGNPGKGYHGACGTADEKYEEMHKHVKNLTDGDDKTVKHYLDSGHGEKLAGREEDHDHIKSDFKKFMKYYRPEMNDSKPAVKEETAPVGKPQKIALKTAVIKLHPKGVASDTEEGWAKPKIKEGTMKSYKDFLQSLDEKLIGKQKKIDKNHNNKIDAEDFKLLRKEEVELDESIYSSAEQAKNVAAALKQKHNDGNYSVVKTRTGHKVVHAYDSDAKVKSAIRSVNEESTDHKAEYEHHMNKHIEHAESGDWDKAEEHAEKAEDAATKHFKATGKKIYDPGYTGGHEHITSSQNEQKIDEIKMADVPSRIIKGKSYGADYEDPEGAFETKKDMKKPEKAGRKAGAGAGVYKPRATMSKLKSAGATYK